MLLKELKPSIIELFISAQLSYSEDSLFKYGEHFSRKTTLQEIRIITAGGIRQSGSTTACARLFDPSKDIYISYSYNQVCEFNRLLYENEIVPHKKINFLYSTIAKQSSEILSRDLGNKIISKLTTYQDERGEWPFYQYRSTIENELRVYNYTFPKQLRGVSIKPGAVYWFDLGNGLAIKHMESIKHFIELSDAIQGDGSQRYVIL